MEKALVAQRVANQLAVTENAIDGAMTETSALLTGLLEARRELGLSAVFGDEAAQKVTEALATLAAARKTVIEAHTELAELKLRAGIRTKLIVGDKPNSLSAEKFTEVSARRAS
jgi:hypothetical protein